MLVPSASCGGRAITPQQRGVDDHRQRTQGHGRPGDHRVEPAQGRNRHAEAVVHLPGAFQTNLLDHLGAAGQHIGIGVSVERFLQSRKIAQDVLGCQLNLS